MLLSTSTFMMATAMSNGGGEKRDKLRRTLSGIKTGLTWKRSTSQSGSAIRNDFSKIAPYRDEVGTELKTIGKGGKDSMKIEVSLSRDFVVVGGVFVVLVNGDASVRLDLNVLSLCNQHHMVGLRSSSSTPSLFG